MTEKDVESEIAAEKARPRDTSGRFVSGPGDADAFDKAVDAAYAQHAQALDAGNKQRAGLEALMTGGEPAEAEQSPDAASTAESEDTPSAKSPKADSKALDAAKKALQRAKVPAKILEKLSEEELVEYGESVSKQLSASDSLSRELGELRKAKTESNAPKKESSTDEQPFDIDAELQPIKAKTLDEELVNGFGQILKKQQQANDAKVAALQAKLDAILPDIERSKSERLQRVADEARSKLVKRFPQLSDDDSFGEAIAAAAALREKYPGDTPDELMERGARAAGIKEVSESTAPQPPRKPRVGSPSTETSNARPKVKTWGDAVDRAYALASKGLSEHEIREQLRR